jgi:epoxide hydrolase
LTDPVAHNVNPKDAFHVICPTLPGFGFSAKPTKPEWGVEKIATAWNTLMVRLGYDQYFAQSGDWGAIITLMISLQNFGNCVGTHLTMPLVKPDPDTMDDLSALEKSILTAIVFYQENDSGYSKQQTTSPQTLGYALADSHPLDKLRGSLKNSINGI